MGRLEHIKESLEENKTLYSSDRNYLEKLIEQHIKNQEKSEQTRDSSIIESSNQGHCSKCGSELLKSLDYCVKCRNQSIRQDEIKQNQAIPTLPKTGSSVGNKISTIFTIISIISVILLIVVFMPQTQQRVVESTEKLIDANLNLLDICVNTKTLGDIVNCDKDIPGQITKICNDNKVKECDARIVEYYDTRDSRIELAYNTLNSVTINLLQACEDDAYDSGCVESISKAKNFCNKYRGTIGYYPACDNLWSNSLELSNSDTGGIDCGSDAIFDVKNGVCVTIDTSQIDPMCEVLRVEQNRIIAEYGPFEEYSDFRKTYANSLSSCSM